MVVKWPFLKFCSIFNASDVKWWMQPVTPHHSTDVTHNNLIGDIASWFLQQISAGLSLFNMEQQVRILFEGVSRYLHSNSTPKVQLLRICSTSAIPLNITLNEKFIPQKQKFKIRMPHHKVFKTYAWHSQLGFDNASL